MKNLKLWLVILLVFVAGVAAGVVGTRAFVRHFVKQVAANPTRARDLIERRMVKQLDLDPEQRRQVHQILNERQAAMRELRLEFAPRFSLIVSNAESQISAKLTPEQRKKLEKLREENQRLWPEQPNKPPLPPR